MFRRPITRTLSYSLKRANNNAANSAQTQAAKQKTMLGIASLGLIGFGIFGYTSYQSNIENIEKTISQQEINMKNDIKMEKLAKTEAGMEEILKNMEEQRQMASKNIVKAAFVESEEEKKSPQLYAFNVQKLMAEKAGTSCTDFIRADGSCVWTAVVTRNYCHQTGLIGVDKIHKDTSLSEKLIVNEVFETFLKIADSAYGRNSKNNPKSENFGKHSWMTGEKGTFSEFGIEFIEPILTVENILDYCSVVLNVHDQGVHVISALEGNLRSHVRNTRDRKGFRSQEFCALLAQEYANHLKIVNEGLDLDDSNLARWLSKSTIDGSITIL